MQNLPPLSLYLHIPWCVRKCPYCDFNTQAIKGNIPHQEYVDHMLTDLEQDYCLTDGRTVNTLFIGGGTPSLLSVNALQSLLAGVRQRLPMAPDAEITIEANPGTVDTDRFAAYQQAGINRISLGVQSFNLEKLSSLGRIHDAEEARLATQLVSTLGLNNFNLDLMHGLPGQSLTEALDDLAQAIVLAPSHVSWYQLTIEPKTLFGLHPPELPDDDVLWDIYQRGDRLLKAAGYFQYETSAYAQLGFQCCHNLNYWRFGDYLGIGCGAHGKLTQSNCTVVRTVKTQHPRGYMQSNYLAKRYQVASADLPFEYFMNRFRLLEAVPRVEFTNFTGLEEHVVRAALDQALAGNYITENDSHWQVTKKGQLFLNSLLEMFIL
ncbi:Oxygen-independent coproporphyrinogen-III oxidase-like protein YggW [Candidatus Moranella endobia PCVAL]|uniref:Heme chaperone HemW n=1 Tax=Moranella endobia (strain PCIT) TaxID=903503 RepID=F7XY22_MOREP|nr:radical SAM family heme chaperone HemW [Candidatus Moranella endobia]AEI74998.1 putative oxygen-independent coproporphyrinogen III oxidase [Candidatus Moranella endobia PCIT]AGJ61246.1 Oxygen-independent coproporphyrinogen-III oxidase-like protein YggW [Candidatus Moranella endobia PCVAL]